MPISNDDARIVIVPLLRQLLTGTPVEKLVLHGRAEILASSVTLSHILFVTENLARDLSEFLGGQLQVQSPINEPSLIERKAEVNPFHLNSSTRLHQP